MISKIFSLAVAAALLYLVQQQFPQEARGMLEWMGARVEAVASRASSWSGGRSTANESDLRAEVEPSVTQPPAGDVEVVAEAGAVPEAAGDAASPRPARGGSPVVRRTPLAVGGSGMGPQVAAADLVTPDTTSRPDREAAHVRRDALAALAERMETLAIERMR